MTYLTTGGENFCIQSRKVESKATLRLNRPAVALGRAYQHWILREREVLTRNFRQRACIPTR